MLVKTTAFQSWHVFLRHSVEWCGYPMAGWMDGWWKKFWWYVYSFWHNSRTWQTHWHTQRQTDTAWRHRPRLCITSRGKNSSVLFSSSWSSMLVVTNEIHWCVAVCGVNCTADRRNCWSHSTSHRFDSQIFVENRNFCLYPTCIWGPL